MIQNIYIVICFSFLLCCPNSFAQTQNDSLPSSAQSTPEDQFQHYFYDALMQKGIENYSKAIDALLKCGDLFPQRAVVFYELGDLYFMTKKYGRAESNLQKAIDLDPDNFWYKEKLYHLYVDQNDYEKAIQAVQPLLYKNQDYEQDLVNLYASAGRFDEALSQIDKLDQRLGYSTNRDQTRIEIYKQTANQKGHIKFLKNRLEESPKNAQNFLTLIYTLSQYNLKEEAFSTAKLFLKTHPKSHIAHVALYKFYLDAKAYDKAIVSMKIVTASNVLAPHLKVKVLSDFMRFVQQNPEYKDVLLEVQPAPSLDTSSRSSLEWAHYYEQQNQIDKALEFYEKALSESPENLDAIKAFVKLCLVAKQYDRVVVFTATQLELFPTQLELYLARSRAQLALEQIDEALETLEMGVDYIFEEDEIAVQYYRLIANLYKRKNNIKKAKAFTNSANAIQLEQ